MHNSATPWTVAHQASLSIGFSRQEYWRGLPCPSPDDLPTPGIESASLMSPAAAGGLFTSSTTQEACILRAEKMVLLALLSRLLQVYSLSICVINWSFFPIPQLPRCISPCLPYPYLPYCFFSCKEKSCPSVSEFFLFISSFIYYLINIQK